MNAPMDHQELIFEYATGSLPEGPSLVAASYLAMNEDARHDYETIEALGGALFEDLEATPMAADALDQVMARLDAEGSRPIMLPTRHDDETEAVLPAPLKRYVPKNISDLKWSSIGRGVEQCEL
ncbi:MAG: hypothetical protein R3360_06820, partial [Alphaproteobacteria bacterium]|nr:hypothetical protein [Alphaproteobacteria bacterium]